MLCLNLHPSSPSVIVNQPPPPPPIDSQHPELPLFATPCQPYSNPPPPIMRRFPDSARARSEAGLARSLAAETAYSPRPRQLPQTILSLPQSATRSRTHVSQPRLHFKPSPHRHHTPSVSPPLPPTRPRDSPTPSLCPAAAPLQAHLHLSLLVYRHRNPLETLTSPDPHLLCTRLIPTLWHHPKTL